MRKLPIGLALLLITSLATAQSEPGHFALQKGDFAKAREEVNAARGRVDDVTLSLMTSRIDVAENKLTSALDSVNAVLQQHPDSAEAHAIKGEILSIKTSRASLFRSGRLAKETLASFEAALKLDPANADALVGMIRFRLRAPTLFGGSTEKAIELIDRLYEIDPVLARLELADVHQARNDKKQRLEVLQQLMQSHPGDPRAWLELGFVEQAERNWPQAHRYFMTALNAANDTNEHTTTAQSARYQIGRTAVFSGEHVDAGIKALTDYLNGPEFADLPDAAWAYYRRGLLYASSDQKNRASDDFGKAAVTDDRDLRRALAGL